MLKRRSCKLFYNDVFATNLYRKPPLFPQTTELNPKGFVRLLEQRVQLYQLYRRWKLLSTT